MADAKETDGKPIAKEQQQPEQPEHKEKKEKRVGALDEETIRKLGLLTGNSNKVNVGKAVLWRDVGIPVAVMTISVIFALTAGTVGKYPPRREHDSLDVVADFVKNRAENKFNKRGGKSAVNCTLFLGKSSIPGAGRSLFAGREYAVGDIVVRC
jgi:hypothetical protein